MSIDYTALFSDLGRLIARLDSYNALGATTLPADLLTLLTQFGVRWLPPEGVASTYGGFQQQVTGWRRTLASFTDRRLLDQVLVLDQLSLSPGTGLNDVLDALAKQMVTDSMRVKACSCTVGAPVYASANRGDGKVWVTTILDGFNSPLSDGPASIRYDRVASELCVPAETMVMECVADSVLDGLTEGSESFTWTGGPFYGSLDVRTEGSGPGPGLSVANASNNLLSGGDFETWSGAVPSGWTVAAGTVAQSTATFHRGLSSASITGPQALVRLTQSLPAGLVQGRRRYFLGCSLLASAAAAGATLRLYLTDATGTAVGEVVQLDGASFPTAAWGQVGGFVGFPTPIPSTWNVVVEVTSLPAVTLYLDDVVLTPATYSGGVGVALTAGDVPWQRGDKVSFTVANDGAGKIQSYWRKRYRAQLPSVASGLRPNAGLLLLWSLMNTTVAETVLDSQVV